MTQSQKNLFQGLFWAAVAIFVWSGSLVLLRFGVTTHLNAYDLTALRFGVAGVLLLPVIVRRGVAYDRLGVIGLALMICGFGSPYIILISKALKTAPASAAGALNPGAMAVGSVLLGAIAFKDRISPLRVVGIVLIGLALLGQVASNSAGFAEGYAILVLTGIM